MHCTFVDILRIQHIHVIITHLKFERDPNTAKQKTNKFTKDSKGEVGPRSNLQPAMSSQPSLVLHSTLVMYIIAHVLPGGPPGAVVANKRPHGGTVPDPVLQLSLHFVFMCDFTYYVFVLCDSFHNLEDKMSKCSDFPIHEEVLRYISSSYFQSSIMLQS